MLRPHVGRHVRPTLDARDPLTLTAISRRGRLGVALALAAAHDALSGQWPLGLGHDRSLPLDLVVGAEIDDDPVSRAAQLVGAGGVREERGEVPGAALGVENR